MKIGIVSEGVSDFKILKHIIGHCYRDCDPNIIPLKPKLNTQGKQNGFGTWQGVFNYISDDSKLIVESLEEGCDFVVIQIDTDVCDQYGVDKNLGVNEKFSEVCEIIKKKIHPDFPIEKAVFAICFDEIECWLIPFVSDNKKECDNMDRCLNIVNKHISKQGITIDKDNKNSLQAQRAYEKILSNKKKKVEIEECSKFNYGFEKFLYQLNEIISA